MLQNVCVGGARQRRMARNRKGQVGSETGTERGKQAEGACAEEAD